MKKNRILHSPEERALDYLRRKKLLPLNCSNTKGDYFYTKEDVIKTCTDMGMQVLDAVNGGYIHTQSLGGMFITLTPKRKNIMYYCKKINGKPVPRIAVIIRQTTGPNIS